MTIKNTLKGIADNLLLEVNIAIDDVREGVLPDLAAGATKGVDAALAKVGSAVVDFRKKVKDS